MVLKSMVLKSKACGVVLSGCVGLVALAGSASGQAPASLGGSAQGLDAASAAPAQPIDADRARVVASPLTVSSRETRSTYATPLDMDMAAIDALASVDRMLLVGLPLDGVATLDVDLERVSVMDPNAVIVNGNEAVALGDRRLNEIYSGEIAGEPGSWVFLSFSEYGVRGIVETQGETHVISSGPYGGPGAALEPVVYNLTDLPEGEISWVDYACSAIDPGTPMPEAAQQAIEAARAGLGESGLPAGRGGLLGTAGVEGDGDEEPGDPCRVVNVAIETDVEFAEQFGPGAGDDDNPVVAYVESLVAANNVIYRRNVNVRLNIVYTRTWRGFPLDGDPWEGNSTFARLQEIRDIWTPSGAPAQVDWQSAHLFSGARLGGGVAYLRAICNPSLAHAVSADMSGFFPTTEVAPDVEEPIDNNNQNWDVVVTAHEWGHNFGAPHTHGLVPTVDGCGLGDCTLSESGTIMSYCHTCPGGLGNIELNFTDRILNEGIRPYLEFQAPCDLIETSDACDEPEVEPCRADVNQDGKLNSSDFVAWVVAFNNNDPAGDINGDGQVNPSDFFAWLTEFQAGCPQLDG